MEKKKVAILGSTGSIGTQALEIIEESNELEVVALAANESMDLIYEQALKFKPKKICVFHKKKASQLKERPRDFSITSGEDGLIELLETSPDIVVAAMVGMKGLKVVSAAIKKGIPVAIANKELLVSAGEYITSLAKQYNTPLIPLDSEHSAIFQLLKGQRKKEIKKLTLTASGGPFKDFNTSQLKSITVSQALAHPTWQMGAKNSIDSSTLMNKGLEVIEAMWLFDLPIHQIDVLIHPQSIVHALVQWEDESFFAQLSNASMLLPISYALHYPDRKPLPNLPCLDFSSGLTLDFQKPDMDKFKCLALAFEAIKIGKSMPCFMNASNEVLVSRFVKNQISWLDISEKLEKLMYNHLPSQPKTLEDILEIDNEARLHALTI